MKTRRLIVAIAVLVAVISIFALFFGVERANSDAAGALAADDIPMVTGVAPNSGPNDLDTPIVITGTGFAAVLSGDLVVTPPTVRLGDRVLLDTGWISSTQLTATAPWGLDPGDYALTVINPNGSSGNLADAFTVTEGIGTWKTSGPYGGWVEYLAMGDEQGEIIYAVVKNVGLFRSRDGGESWELIFIEIGHENRVAVDTTNPDRLYIAKHAYQKDGLYRSEDGGDTWFVMPKPVPDTDINGFLAFVNPHNGTLFGALFVSPGDLCNWVCGLFRFDETDQTWIRLEEPGLLDETTPVSAVAFDPHEPNTMFAALVGGRVLKSVDGGQTWSLHSESPMDYIRELVVNPVGGELWMCGPLADGAQKPGGLFRYDGSQWVSMYSSFQPFPIVRNIIFDHGAADVQTQHIWIAANSDGVLTSQDGGQQWERISPMGSEAIALNPARPQTIYSGDPEGVAKTNDGGASWQTINQGLTGIVPYHMGVSPHDPAVVYGAASIGIFGSRNGGETWQRRTVSAGGPIVVDPAQPLHVVNADYGRLLIADDGWNFSREIPIPMPPGMATEDYSAIPNAMIARPGMWLMGVGYSRTLPYYNYEGGGRIYRSEDGENWTWVGPLLDCPPTGLGFDPVDENILYAATSGMRGGVNCGEVKFLRSTDGGQTWQESMAGLPQPYGDRSLIAVEPMPPYRIFLNGSFVSSDQGITWSEVNAPCASFINDMLFLPGSPPVLYAGTGIGLFRSMDGAQTWERAQGIMGQLEVWSMAGTTTPDRQILYVANIGVYRYTTLSWSGRVYLPLVVR